MPKPSLRPFAALALATLTLLAGCVAVDEPVGAPVDKASVIGGVGGVPNAGAATGVVQGALGGVLAQAGGDPARTALATALAAGLTDGGLTDAAAAQAVLGTALSAPASTLGSADLAALRAAARGHATAVAATGLPTAAPAQALAGTLSGGLFAGLERALAVAEPGATAPWEAFADAATRQILRETAAAGASAPSAYGGAATAWALAVGESAGAHVGGLGSAAKAAAFGEASGSALARGALAYAAAHASPPTTLPADAAALAAGVVDGAARAAAEAPLSAGSASAHASWAGDVAASAVTAAAALDAAPTADGAALLRAWADGLVHGGVAAGQGTPAVAGRAAGAAQAYADALHGATLEALAEARAHDPAAAAAAVRGYADGLGQGLPAFLALSDAGRAAATQYAAGLAGAAASAPALPPGGPGEPFFRAWMEGAVDGALARLGASDALAARAAGVPLGALADGFVAGASRLALQPQLAAADASFVTAYTNGLAAGYVDAVGAGSLSGGVALAAADAATASAWISGAMDGLTVQGAVDGAWRNGDAARAAVNAFGEAAGAGALAWARDAKSEALREASTTTAFAAAVAVAGADEVTAWLATAAPPPAPADVAGFADDLVAYETRVVAAAADARAFTSLADDPAALSAALAGFADATAEGAGWVLDDAVAGGAVGPWTGAAHALVDAAAENGARFADAGYAHAFIEIVEGLGAGLPPPAAETAGRLAAQPALVEPWAQGVLAALDGIPPHPAQASVDWWSAWAAATTAAAARSTGEAGAAQADLAEAYAASLFAGLLDAAGGAPGPTEPVTRWARALVEPPLSAAPAATDAQRDAALAWLSGAAAGLGPAVEDVGLAALPDAAVAEITAYLDGVAAAVAPLAPDTGALCGVCPAGVRPSDDLTSLAQFLTAETVDRLVLANPAQPRAAAVRAWAEGTAAGVLDAAGRLPAQDPELVDEVAAAIAAGVSNLPGEREALRYSAHELDVLGRYAEAVAAGATSALAADLPGVDASADLPFALPAEDQDPLLWIDALTDPLFRAPQLPGLGSPPDAARADRVLAYVKGVAAGGTRAALDAAAPPAVAEAARAEALAAWAFTLRDLALDRAAVAGANSAATAAWISGVAEGGVGAALAEAEPLPAEEAAALRAFVLAVGSQAGAFLPANAIPADPTEPWTTYGRALGAAVGDLPPPPVGARAEVAAAHAGALFAGLAAPPTGPTEAYLATVDAWLRAEFGAALAPPLPAVADAAAPDAAAAAAFLERLAAHTVWAIPPDAEPFLRERAGWAAEFAAGGVAASCRDFGAAKCADAAVAVAEAAGRLLGDGNVADDGDALPSTGGAGLSEAVEGAVDGLTAWKPGPALEEQFAAAGGALEAALQDAGELAGRDPAAVRESARVAVEAAGEVAHVTPSPSTTAAIARSIASELLEAASEGRDPAALAATAAAAAWDAAEAVQAADALDRDRLRAKVDAIAAAWLDEADGAAGAASLKLRVKVSDGLATLARADLDGTRWLGAGASGHRVQLVPQASLPQGGWSMAYQAVAPGGKVVGTGAIPLVPADGAYAGTLPGHLVAAWPEGTRVELTAQQRAGSASVAYAADTPLVYRVDARAPAAKLDVPARSAKAAFDVAWSAVDAGSGVARYRVEVQRDGGAWQTLHARTAETKLSFTGQPGGEYAFRVQAVDAAGNVGAWALAEAVVDAAASAARGVPSLAFVAPLDGVVVRAPVRVELATGDADGTKPTVVVELRRADEKAALDIVHSGAATFFDLDPTGLADGAYDLVARASDGSLESTEETLRFWVDRAGPLVLGAFPATERGELVVTARVARAVGVAAEVYEGRALVASGELRDDGVAPDVAAGDGVWSARLAIRPDGQTVTVTAKDEDGRASTRTLRLASLPRAPGDDADPAPPLAAPEDEPRREAPVDAILLGVAVVGLAALGRRRRSG